MTLEEIRAAISENAELQQQVVEIVPTLPAGKALIENAQQKYFNENIGTKIGEIHGLYDKDIETVTGLKKPDGKKSYEFLKEVLTDLHGKQSDPEKLKEYQKQINELNAKIEKGEGGSVLKQQFEALKKTHQETVEQYEKRINDLNSSVQGEGIRRELDNGLAKLKIKDLPQEVRESYIRNQYDDIMKSAKVIDGKVVFHDKDGKAILNKVFAPMSAEELLAERLKPIVEEGRVVAGGGGKGTGAQSQVSHVDLSGYKTRTELTAAITAKLISEGKVKNSPEFTKLADEIFTQLNGKNLPLR